MAKTVKTFQYLIISLLESGIHLGASKSKYNPALGSTVIGHRFDTSILNLERTVVSLKQVSSLFRALGFSKSRFLFVNYDLVTQDVTSYYAGLLDQSCLSTKWIGGFLTNYKELNTRLGWPVLNSGSSSLVKANKAGLPKAVFIVNLNQNNWAFNEAVVLNLPVVSVVSSDAKNFEFVEYSIPGNETSVISVNLYSRVIADSYLQGLLMRYLKLIDVKLNSFYIYFKLLLKRLSLVSAYYRLLLLVMVVSNLYLKKNNSISTKLFVSTSIKLLLLLSVELNKTILEYNSVSDKAFSKFFVNGTVSFMLQDLHNLMCLVIKHLLSLNSVINKSKRVDLVSDIFNYFNKIKTGLNKNVYLFTEFDSYLYYGLKHYYK